MDDTPQTSPMIRVGLASPTGKLSSLLASSGHLRQEGVVHVTNSKKMNKLLPDSVCKVPRTYNNEVNTGSQGQSTTIQKNINIKTSTPQQERYRM
jgi:hypothetical protein